MITIRAETFYPDACRKLKIAALAVVIALLLAPHADADACEAEWRGEERT